jgi:hypothetical protein
VAETFGFVEITRAIEVARADLHEFTLLPRSRTAPPQQTQTTMAALTATTNAPKTVEDLQSLLANDNKVKLAGTSYAPILPVQKV